jgi:hypothetical protein
MTSAEAEKRTRALERCSIWFFKMSGGIKYPGFTQAYRQRYYPERPKLTIQRYT